MKQHINFEDLKTLSTDKIAKFYCNINNFKYPNSCYNTAWFTHCFHNRKFDPHGSFADRFVDKFLEQLNIGKMIEILKNNIPDTGCIENSIDIEIDLVTNTSLVEYLKDGKYVSFEKKELCDSLWEAVLSILE